MKQLPNLHWTGEDYSLTFDQWWEQSVATAKENSEGFSIFLEDDPLLKLMAEVSWEASQGNPKEQGL